MPITAVTNILLVAHYSKSSRPVLLVDAQATVIEAALKGVAKWNNKAKADDSAQQEQIVGGLRLRRCVCMLTIIPGPREACHRGPSGILVQRAPCPKLRGKWITV